MSTHWGTRFSAAVTFVLLSGASPVSAYDEPEIIGANTGIPLLAPIKFQNKDVERLYRSDYDKASLDAILQALVAHNTLKLRRYSSGGHSAVTVTDDSSLESAIDGLLILQWDRDNIMQAMGERLASKSSELGALPIAKDAWKKGLAASLKHHFLYKKRFIDFIDGHPDLSDSMLRPHIRYNPITYTDVSDPWGHAQNDSLSFMDFMLFFGLNRGELSFDDADLKPAAETLAVLVPIYFSKIAAWDDFDLGAWEDKRAQHASSIGTVLAAMREQLVYMKKHGPLSTEVDGKKYTVTVDDVQNVIDKCQTALSTILPNEFIKSDKQDKRADASPVRNVDAALVNALLLGTYAGTPLVDDQMSMKIITNIEKDLMGPIGIARYPGDIWDGRVDRRDLKDKEEAQWSHVSPTICVILGEIYRRTGDQRYLQKQIDHFNRTLAHVNPRWKIPEAYIVDPSTRKWVSDANEPLAWAQSVTIMAFDSMYKSLQYKAAHASELPRPLFRTRN